MASGTDLSSSPESYKYFGWFEGLHGLKAAELDPILLVTLHPVKMYALSSGRDFSVPKISAYW